jgi:hypothetical protein
MKWCRRLCFVVSAVPMMIGAAAADAGVLRVCVDPNNLPFSECARKLAKNRR